jgi:GTP cyclohydrolase II
LNESFGPGIAAGMIAVDRAVADLRRGGFVVIEHDGEAVLTQAAETVTPESLATLSRLGNGGTSLALTARRASVLNYVTNGARVVTLPVTGAVDALTVRRLVDPTLGNGADPIPPGAFEGADERGFPGAAITLSKLAQMLPAALTAPLPAHGARESGAPKPNGLPRVGLDAIVDYPRLAAATLHPVSEAHVPLSGAENARVVGFRPAGGGNEHFAIVIGDPAAHQPVLCRLHSECFTGDLLGSLRCDCGPQLRSAIELIGLVGHGVVLYLAHEGRGIGLINKLRAYQLQDSGMDTLDANQHLGFEPDERSFHAAAVMLRHLGIGRVRLLTNNPTKVGDLVNEGIEVVERVPHSVPANPHNRAYLTTKATRAGHFLENEQ